MKRKEQIQDAAADHRDCVCCGFYDPIADARQDSFIKGAEWADENPKESKQDIINNAKEFLRINFERGDDGYSCYYPDGLERLLWQFDLWMR